MPVDPQLIEYLSQFVTDARRRRMEEVLAERTRYLTVALEDLYQSHNASAVLRSCDGLGIQDVHIVENRNRYQVNPDVALGTSQWLTLRKYGDAGAESDGTRGPATAAAAGANARGANDHEEGTGAADRSDRAAENTLTAYAELRRAGYRIVATAPHRGTIDLEDFQVEEAPTALVFGNELDGLTDTALENADAFLRIPMRGFVESFNISVSAALCMHFLTHRLRRSQIDWHLSEEEKQELRLAWLRQSIRRVEALEEQYRTCT